MINPRLRQSGLTIIEGLIMVMIVLVLAAIVMPRFLDAEGKIQQLKVKQNMRIVQMAADAYAVSNLGKYPLSADDPGFKSFFPGGNANIQSPSGGNYPENPFTHIEEAPVNGNITDVKQTRYSPPLDLGGPRVAGKIFYNAIVSSEGGNPIGYAIVGAGKDGKAMSAPSPQLTGILSNLLVQSAGNKTP
jgi:type II secretory pathway pseudopilin PulG